MLRIYSSWVDYYPTDTNSRRLRIGRLTLWFGPRRGRYRLPRVEWATAPIVF
jgi:hypothetical protein